jgi:gliding-associated putative ABC transporter substrate-binding component GldG
MRWTQKKTQSLTRISLILGILILVNFISVRLFTRMDLTKERLYTLADASKSLVKSLDDKLLVKAYFTEDLPPPYNNNRRFVKDQLDDYRAYSNRNLQYELISPSDEKIEQEAQRYGIPPVQVQVINNEKLEVKKAYMGMVFLYEDKQEVIPVVQKTENLEYDMSSTIKKITSKTIKKIALLSGHNEPSFQNLKNLRTLLSKQYEMTTADVSAGKPVPNGIAAILVIAPETKFSENEKYQLDQYVMAGGRVAFLVNKVKGDFQAQYGQPLDLNLDDLLQQYGAKVNTDLVKDIQCASVTLMQQQGFITFQNRVPFPFLPMASDFSKTSMIAKDLQGIIFVFVSSIDTSSAAQKGLKTRFSCARQNAAADSKNFLF